ncbi:MAG: hypothetical protein L0332_31010 [Chloroflexi bacterium]|nr:hypothetical protein [Chloroflexota bacterium]MCI0731131.1 hypothetical protein [Chloroflexota bacterium]
MAQPDRTTIENRALRYLLSSVGDAATVAATLLPDGSGWQVDVYGAGLAQPAGTLVYSLAGVLLAERSTPPAEMHRVISDANQRHS